MDPSSASAGQSPFAAVGILRAAAVALVLVRDPLSPASSPTATPMDPVTPPASWVRTIVLRPGGAWDPHLSHLVDGMWIPA